LSIDRRKTVVAQSEVDLTIEGDRIIVTRHIEYPRYDLDDMLAQCDFSVPRSDEEQAWLAMPSAGEGISE
jgi:antitoxin component of MazEF toxin-antitoxin module